MYLNAVADQTLSCYIGAACRSPWSEHAEPDRSGQIYIFTLQKLDKIRGSSYAFKRGRMNEYFDLDEYHRVDGLVLRAELVLITVGQNGLRVLMFKREPGRDNTLVLPGGYLRRHKP